MFFFLPQGCQQESRDMKKILELDLQVIIDKTTSNKGCDCPQKI